MTSVWTFDRRLVFQDVLHNKKETSELLVSISKFCSFSREQGSNSDRPHHIHIGRSLTRTYQNPSLYCRITVLSEAGIKNSLEFGSINHTLYVQKLLSAVCLFSKLANAEYFRPLTIG